MPFSAGQFMGRGRTKAQFCTHFPPTGPAKPPGTDPCGTSFPFRKRTGENRPRRYTFRKEPARTVPGGTSVNGRQVVEEGGEFRDLAGDRDAGMHEGHAGGDDLYVVALQPVVPVRRQSLALDVFLGTVDGQIDGDDGDERLALVLCDALPGDQVDLLEGIGKAVVIAEEVEVVVLVVEVAHLFAGPDLLLFELGGVQLITEGAAHGDGCLGLEGHHGTGFRDMRAHAAHGVEEGGPVVELEVVQGLGVVGAPVLDEIGQHGGVETAASAGAALKHDVGMGLHVGACHQRFP